MSSPVAKALWGHYKRHPLQIVLVWLGLTLGIALLVGVMGVNQQARESYRDGELLFSNPFPYRIRHSQPALKVPQGFYVQLRRDGFNQCVPLEEQRIVLENGRSIEVVGVDPIALFSSFRRSTMSGNDDQQQMLSLMQPPYPVLVGDQLANYMGFEDGQMLKLESGRTLGPLHVVNEERIKGPRLIADMSLVRQLQPGSGLTAILCGDLDPQSLSRLQDKLPAALKLEKQETAGLEP